MAERRTNSPAGGFKAPEPAELSALLPRYEVSDLIGCGGTGAVYLARQKSLDRKVAIRILPREFGADPRFRASFESEAKVMARLNHPNLIGVYDFGEAGGYLFVIMEMVDGKSLFRSAQGKAIKQQVVARLIQEICEGLAHAHEAGVIHGNLNPANILIDSKQRPRIGDFGLAAPKASAEHEGERLHAPEYTAPEIVEDHADPHERSDVFSTGVILYELLTGKVPGATYVPPSQLEAVDSRFDRIVRRALHPAPAMRFANAGEMSKEVDDLCASLPKSEAGLLKSGASPAKLLPAGETEPATTAAPLPSSDRSARHQRIVARNLVIIAVLLVIILAVVVAYNQRENENERQRLLADKLAISESRSPSLPRPSRKISPGRPDPGPRPDPRPGPAPASAPHQFALDTLQSSLARGDRSRFPHRTRELGDRRVFLVETPMTWQSASAFAEAHGGHLSALRSESEKSQLSSMISNRTTVWLGGGTTGGSGWGWIEGSAWVLSTEPPAPSGNYASLARNGVIDARPGNEEYPFFIQWHMNGDNPGTLDAQLTRTRNSLAAGSPAYPPGTLSHGDRRYLIIDRMVRWREAREVSRRAGGHLAVPGDKDEWDYLRDAGTILLPKTSVAWIGGQYRDGSWSWITGEKWTFTAWVPAPPNEIDPKATALCVVSGESGGWDNVDPAADKTASAFIIEWSKDRDTPRSAPPPARAAEWLDLRKRAGLRVARDQANHARAIQDNSKDYRRAVDNWYNGLPLQGRVRYLGAVNEAKQIILPSGRIDKNGPGKLRKRRKELGNICKHYLINQRTSDASYEESLDKLRKDYIAQMQEKRETAQADRRIDEIGAIEEEIRACGHEGGTFREHLETGQ